jgi:hypothetical protein
LSTASTICARTANEFIAPYLIVTSTGCRRPGLVPWARCSALAATAPQLGELRVKAVASDGVFVAAMPAAAQETRVYNHYLDRVSRSGVAELGYLAVSIVGPRNRVDKLVKRLALLD